MNKRILELALEALEARKEKIAKEIDELQAGLTGSQRLVPRKQPQSERMKAHWAARKRAESGNAAAVTGQSRGPQSVAARKAASERMKAYWAKRRAAQGKVEKKPARAKAAKEGKR